MKTLLQRVVLALIMLGVAALPLAPPVAARPKDPDRFQATRLPQRDCQQRTSFGDPPAANCTAGAAEGATNQPVSWHPAEAQSLIRNAADAVANANSLQYTLDMQMTMTSIRGDSWPSESTLAGSYTAPDRLDGIPTITNPWTTTQSQVVVASGEAYVAHPQTEEWENRLKVATSYYPVIFAGCLLRMAAADTDSLVLLGVEWLGGELVHHLAGPGGARDELELEYWLGVEDGLPRQATVRTGERTGWSNEAHTIRITATLKLSSYGTPAVIQPPIRATAG